MEVPRAIPAEEEEENEPPVQEVPHPVLSEVPPSAVEPSTETEPPEDESAEEPETKVAQPAPAAAADSGPVHRASRILAPVLLLVALLLTVNYFFDPLGLRKDFPDQARPDVQVEERAPSRLANRPLVVDPEDLNRKLEQMSVEGYLTRLEQLKLFPAKHPDGLFVGAAFVPVGSRLNPELGLTLKAVDDSQAVIEDEYFQEYQILFQ